MASPAPAGAHTAQRNSLYFDGVDGLRFLAFLAVFGNHLPAPAAVGIWADRGWVGVEMFFAISAFLLFRLLDAEYRRDGRISIVNFYRRRILRIYPLLVAYYGITFIARHGFLRPMAWTRFGTTLASVDNIAAWWWNYNYTIQGVGHLWTLAFEFQVYAFLPFLFLAWKKWGTGQFLAGLVLVEIAAFSLRFVGVHDGASAVGLYVIPYFRPESILLGLALAVIRPRWPPWISLLVAVGCAAVFVDIDDPTRLYSYFPAAVMAVGLVDAAVRLQWLRVGLAWAPIRYLGTISYGLYVFHVDAIYAVVRVLQHGHLTALYNRATIIVLSLALTAVAATVSYRYLEQPFLRLKRRFTAVEGR